MSQVTDQAGPEQGLADQASAKAQDAASVAQEKASELRDQGSARLREQFDQRSQRGAQARSLAEALRRSGNDLSSEGKRGREADRQAADRIERVGIYLEQKSGDEVMRDIETFARRRPWMLAGLGMLAGVAAARFMKASSEQRYDDIAQDSSRAEQYGGVTDGRAAGDATAATVSWVGCPSALRRTVAQDPYAGAR